MSIGDLGHIAIIVSLITILLSAYSYWVSLYSSDLTDTASWHKIARVSFYAHAVSVIGIITTLFLIIFLKKYEYHYAWSHSSNDLPVYYMISCFWEGQEGSFLLWAFWNAVVGGLMIATAKKWEKSLMAIFTLVQAFLLTMILGVYIPSIDIKLGSSPFILLNQALDAAIFKENPSFVPLDGNGLNPLLQNYWMVIHPPVIFLGFSLSTVPFCYAFAGLMTNNFTHWIKPAFPWLSATVLIMGAGIMMGAYWAYETLNFGGYWSWDPVENAIYIPWLVLVAAMHGAMLVSKNKPAERLTSILTFAGFLLVLYATFLTRSGILGNSSVHSFTDLGLSGQLLLYLLLFLVATCLLTISKWKEIPAGTDSKTALTYDFWVMLGIITISLAAFQVLIPSSIPVYNSILSTIGIRSNIAPPSDPVTFYSSFQLWFAIAYGILVGIAQLFYHLKVNSSKRLEEVMFWPLVLTILLSSFIVFYSDIKNIKFIAAIASCFYGLFTSIYVIKNYRFTQVKNWGGSLSHAGLSLMIIGMVFSAGYSNVISKNQSLEFAEGQVEEPIIRENILVERNKVSIIKDYSVHYTGSYFEDRHGNKFPMHALLDTNIPSIKIVKRTIDKNTPGDANRFKKGDTVIVQEENRYYQLSLTSKDGNTFHVNPRIQNNPEMGAIASPSIKKFLNKDIYLHITNSSDPNKKKWTSFTDHIMSFDDSLYLRDKLITISSNVREDKNPIVQLNSNETSFALTADISVSNGLTNEILNPLFIVSGNRSVRLYPDHSEAFGTKVLIKKIDPESHLVTLGVAHSQPDWVTVKIIEMPMINILWIGCIVLLFGVGLSLRKRVVETRSSVDLSSEIEVQPDNTELIMTIA